MLVIRQMKRFEAKNALDFDSRTFHGKSRVSRLLRTSEGVGETVSGFLVDKGHENGLEELFLTTTGLIVIRNHGTGKFITALIARPGQVKRYYKALGRIAPRFLIAKALRNTAVKHLNY